MIQAAKFFDTDTTFLGYVLKSLAGLNLVVSHLYSGIGIVVIVTARLWSLTAGCTSLDISMMYFAIALDVLTAVATACALATSQCSVG